MAGLYEFNNQFSEPVYSFTLLTHNADDEPFMSQFHKPSKEKRSIYLVDEDLRSEYLKAKHSSVEELMSTIDGRVFNFSDI